MKFCRDFGAKAALVRCEGFGARIAPSRASGPSRSACAGRRDSGRFGLILKGGAKASHHWTIPKRENLPCPKTIISDSLPHSPHGLRNRELVEVRDRVLNEEGQKDSAPSFAFVEPSFYTVPTRVGTVQRARFCKENGRPVKFRSEQLNLGFGTS